MRSGFGQPAMSTECIRPQSGQNEYHDRHYHNEHAADELLLFVRVAEPSQTENIRMPQ